MHFSSGFRVYIPAAARFESTIYNFRAWQERKHSAELFQRGPAESAKTKAICNAYSVYGYALHAFFFPSFWPLCPRVRAKDEGKRKQLQAMMLESNPLWNRDPNSLRNFSRNFKWKAQRNGIQNLPHATAKLGFSMQERPNGVSELWKRSGRFQSHTRFQIQHSCVFLACDWDTFALQVVLTKRFPKMLSANCRGHNNQMHGPGCSRFVLGLAKLGLRKNRISACSCHNQHGAIAAHK